MQLCAGDMPQVVPPRRLGVALDHDMTKTPAPVYIDFRRTNSREYRATKRDAENMILAQGGCNNDYDDSRWHGHGFPGHIQFIPYVGREPLRPGAKLERDIQVSSLPREHGKPLNVTQMARNRGSVLAVGIPGEEERCAHEEAISSMRSLRGHAREAERFENPHRHYRRELEHNELRHQRLTEQAAAMKGLRTAGLASINPRMGTCGSLPNLDTLRGRDGIAQWRTSTPWAIDGE